VENIEKKKKRTRDLDDYTDDAAGTESIRPMIRQKRAYICKITFKAHPKMQADT
jgi:hypothetical protein